MALHVDAITPGDMLMAWDTDDSVEVAALFDRMVNGTPWGIGDLVIVRLREISPPCSECVGGA